MQWIVRLLAHTPLHSNAACRIIYDDSPMLWDNAGRDQMHGG